ncbi:GNAT family N-acetyltransferase [Maritalea sp. S77]|uniref:GNAT family N-acetyltransferase n=1 Tax=Maritalea sp. S77 TaxID=3415125 RepID=UPI003C7D6454
MTNIQIEHKTPTPQEYCDLRAFAGLSPKSLDAATIALKNSLFGVSLRDEQGNLIGMGRIIGDGGCFAQVTDIAVKPEHQGKGLGKMIMGEIDQFIQSQLPASCWVSLFADGDAHHLYQKYGFGFTAPESLGMAQWIK